MTSTAGAVTTTASRERLTVLHAQPFLQTLFDAGLPHKIETESTGDRPRLGIQRQPIRKLLAGPFHIHFLGSRPQDQRPPPR